jgi:hypothetical protein
VVKRHEFKRWAERQGCSHETVERLTKMVAEASSPVIEWMQPGEWGSDRAWFVNHHVLIAGRAKRSDGVAT